MATVQNMEKAHQNQDKLDKTERVLRQFPHGIRIPDLARKVGVARSTVYGLLRTLDLQKKAFFERGIAYSKDATRKERYAEHVCASTGYRKVFHNKLEFQFSLKHSKSLVLSTPDNPRMFDYDPDYWLDYIIFNDVNKWARTEDKCLAQHFRSGYPKIYALMLQYRSAMDKIGSRGFAETRLEIVGDPEKEASKQTDSHVALPIEVEELRQLLIGKIKDVVRDVAENNFPLQGNCDNCPEHRMILKDA